MTKRELKIESPCHMKWAELKGEGNKRYCGECALHVVDGSAMTKRAAEELVSSSDDRVCMRVAVNEDGQAIHEPETPSERPGRLTGVGLVLASTVLAACGSEAVDEGAPSPPPSEGAPTVPAEDPPFPTPTEVMMGAAVIQHDPMEALGEVEYVEPNQSAEEGTAETMGRMIKIDPTDERHCGPSLDPEDAAGKSAASLEPPKE